MQVECLALSVEVLPIFDVVHLRNELLLVSVGGVQAVVALRDKALEVVIGLLNLAYVDFLKVDHLSEPLQDDFLLVHCKLPQLCEEEPLPHYLRLSKNSIDQLKPACLSLAKKLVGKVVTQVEFDP